MLDVRGSYTIKGYKRAEAEFIAPRLFHRRGALSLLGGWREATQVGFYGLGTDTSKDDRTNYGFQQPYGSATLDAVADAPAADAARRRGAVAVDATTRRGHASRRSRPSIRRRRCPALAPRPPTCTRRARSASTGAPHPAIPAAAASTASRCTTTPTATRSSASGRSTTRSSSTSRSCAKRGSSRCAASPRPRSTRTVRRSRSSCCPSVGGGHYAARLQQLALPRSEQPARCRPSGASWSIASWTRRSSTTPARSPRARSDLDFDGLKSDYGFGVRFHGPFATPLRIEVARSREGTGSDLRDVRRYSETVCHVYIIVCRRVHARQPPDSSGRRARRCSPAPSRRRVRASIRTIRSRASPSRRTRRRRSRTRSGRCTR